MPAHTLTVEDLPGVHGAERINKLGLELFIASDIGESLMATAYLLMEKDELLDTVFYEGVPTITQFIGYLQRKESRYIGCFVRPTLDNAPVELAGVGWLWDVRGPVGGVRAECGMVFFRKWQRSHIPEELTVKIIDYAFGPCNCDVLYGVTPVPNRAAVIFSKRMGFHQTEPLPKYGSWHGEPADAILSYLTKENWGTK